MPSSSVDLLAGCSLAPSRLNNLKATCVDNKPLKCGLLFNIITVHPHTMLPPEDEGKAYLSNSVEYGTTFSEASDIYD